MTVTKDWRSNLLLIAISTLGIVLSCSALLATARLPLLTNSGLLAWVVLLILTLAASRFTVSITTSIGVSRSRKSVADAFVFLAIILYAIPPAETAGPATLLAAIVGFVSTYGLSSYRESIASTAIAVISTFFSASCYGILATLFANGEAGRGLPINVFLVPLCVLAVLHYFLSTLAPVHILNLVEGRPRVLPSQESLDSCPTTYVSSDSAVVLYYAAIRGARLPSIIIGLLIIGLVHLLYRFNERRSEEDRRAKAEQRKHVEVMATI